MFIANTSVSVMPVACPFVYLSHLSSTSHLLSCSFFPSLSFCLIHPLFLSLSLSFLLFFLSMSIPSTQLSVEVRQEEEKSVFLFSKLFRLPSLPSLCPFCVLDWHSNYEFCLLNPTKPYGQSHRQRLSLLFSLNAGRGCTNPKMLYSNYILGSKSSYCLMNIRSVSVVY